MNKLLKVVSLSVILLINCISIAEAQSIKFYDANQFYLYGKAFNTTQPFHRVDTALYHELSPTVKRLLTNSAGLAICFKTNSRTIAAKWCVTDKKPGNNMTLIAQKGLDLYIKHEGKWQFAGVGRPEAACSQSNVLSNMAVGEKECMLFLPLYDELKNIQIGVDEGSTIESLENPFKKRVLIYGSSIVHGASASRPGMAYPAMLSRKTGLCFINLGISGNAKMEKEAAKMVSDVTADAFVLDCVPNPSPAEIKERAENFVLTVREKHPKAPIIIIQSVIREGGFFNVSIGNNVSEQNKEITAAYQRLKDKGVKDLYLITAEKLLGTDHDASTDGTHPNDLGFYRMVEVLAPQISKILATYNIR